MRRAPAVRDHFGRNTGFASAYDLNGHLDRGAAEPAEVRRLLAGKAHPRQLREATLFAGLRKGGTGEVSAARHTENESG